MKKHKSAPFPYQWLDCEVTRLATPAITQEDIEKYIEEYLVNALPLRQKMMSFQLSEENVKRCLFGQQKFLIISRCNLPELSVKILKRLPIYLVRQFVVQVELDSYWYWALTHDVVRSNFSFFKDWKLRESFETLMASHFAQLHVSNYYEIPALERLNSGIWQFVSQPVRDLVVKSNTVLMYVCYPVLEGLAKFALSPLVDSDGFPIAQFSANGKPYDKGNKKISSLDILLHTLEENGRTVLSKPELSDNLRDFRLEIEKMFPPSVGINDGWDTIYALRNASLHGVIGWQLRSGLLTNLICLILWNILDDQTLTKDLQRINKMPMRFFDDNYYPPEL